MKWEDHLHYDETSPSCLRWNHDIWAGRNYCFRRVSAGDAAGGRRKSDGYYTGAFQGKQYKAHQVVWYLHYGEIPDGYVPDHIDGNTSNNIISNLRVVAEELNAKNKGAYRNNTSGQTGVCRMTNRVGNSYWQAKWYKMNGRRGSKYFSVAKLGEDLAFASACEHRLMMVQQLNQQGAGYTERHGVQ